MKRPEQRRRGITHIVGQPLSGKSLRKDVDAELTLLAGGGAEPRQRMLGIAAIAEERTQELSILLYDVDFCVQRRAHPVPHASARGASLAGPRQVLPLHAALIRA